MSSYDTTWDRPHRPGPDDLWQESDCYWWYDERAGVGGFHRIGQRPNRGTGQLSLFAFARDGQRYSSHSEHAITKENRWESGHSVAKHSAESLGDQRMRFRWAEDGSEADLEFYESFYTPRDWSTTGHSDEFMDNLNPDGHLECSGRLRGDVRIGDKTYSVDALAHRDRSWGPRDTSRVSMHRYRMFSGTAGPDFSFASFFLDLKEGPAMAAGFVVRKGQQHDIRGVRVLTTFDYDGVSPTGAVGILTLDNGEVLRVPCSGVQGFLTPLPETGTLSTDTISTFEYQGMRGFVDLEVTNNPGRGSYLPKSSEVSLLQVDNGLSTSVPYEF